MIDWYDKFALEYPDITSPTLINEKDRSDSI